MNYQDQNIYYARRFNAGCPAHRGAGKIIIRTINIMISSATSEKLSGKNDSGTPPRSSPTTVGSAIFAFT